VIGLAQTGGLSTVPIDRGAILIAGMAAMLITIFLGPKFIERLREREFGQQIREEGPQGHHTKAGTPTMGGLIIFAAISVPYLVLSDRDTESLTVFGVALGSAAIGFADDYIKIIKRRSLGLSARWKLSFQIALAVVLWWVAFQEVGLDPSLQIRFFGAELYLGPVVYVVLSFLVLAGASNGVNLTDGLDGLAIGSTLIAAATYAIFTYVAGHKVVATYLQVASVPGVGEVTVFCGALVGAGLGFLWFNAYPAMVFMGDVGALALGAALGAVAVITKQEILLLLVGGLFVIEALSVIFQVGFFKMTNGRRIFRMAPLHHHFELKGWSEPKVIVRFWIIAIALALISMSTLKLR